MRGLRAPRIAVGDEHGPSGDPFPQLAEGARRAEQPILLERQVNAAGEVRFEQVTSGVDVHRQ